MTLRRCLLVLTLAGCGDQTSVFDRVGASLDGGAVGAADAVASLDGTRSDASAPGDASRPDILAPSDVSRPTGRIRVVTGPTPVRALAGVSIRAVGRDAVTVEAVTDDSRRGATGPADAERPLDADRGAARPLCGLHRRPDGAAGG